MLFFICDDNCEVNDFIRNKIAEKYGNSVETLLFTDAVKLIEYIKEEHIPDVIIMDICFENANGIACLREISDLIENIPVIFITGYMEYCQDIFLGFKPWGLLTKPIDEEKLYYHTDNLVTQYDGKYRTIKIFFGRDSFDIQTGDIEYVESSGRKSLYYMRDKKIFEEYIKLDKVSEKLKTGFIRCHKSYLVNLDYVKDVTDSDIVLKSGELIPISRSCKDAVKNDYFEYNAARIGL